MDRADVVIEPLIRPANDADIAELARLLVDTVESGAAVSFLLPLTVEQAADWWQRSMSAADAKAIVLVARDGDNGVRQGCVLIGTGDER